MVAPCNNLYFTNSLALIFVAHAIPTYCVPNFMFNVHCLNHASLHLFCDFFTEKCSPFPASHTGGCLVSVLCAVLYKHTMSLHN